MGSNFNQIAYEYESFHSLVAHCRSRDADAISLHAELTRLRAELDEARRHAKVLADACLMYHVDQLQYDQALDYAEELP